MNRHPSRLRFLAASWLALSLLLFARPSLASPTFPGEMQEYLDMECAPPCSVCHIDNNGGPARLRGGFVKALLKNLLIEREDDTVGPALDGVDMAGTDSDSDGMGDVEELRQGRDPNIVGEGSLCGPLYGCGARVAAHRPVDGSALAAGLLVAGWLWVRRRPRATS